jgi:soluble lytic murein transglycosylase
MLRSETMKPRSLLVLAATALVILTAPCQAARGQRAGEGAGVKVDPAEAFLMARDAIRVGDAGKLQRMMPHVKGYPLEPYLEYWSLRPDRSSPEAISDFLARNEGTLLAEQLRSEWIKSLARRGDWDAFLRERPKLVNEDADMACYGLLARRRANNDDSALDELKAFWLAPRELAEGCVALAREQFESGRYGSEQAWQRFRVLTEAGRLQTAKRVVELLPKAEAPSQQAVSQAFDSPAKYVQTLGKSLRSRASREVAMLAFARMGRSDPSFAAVKFGEALRSSPVREAFSAEERAYVWGHIAAAAARRHMPEALDWFSLAEETALSDDQLAWRTRIALRMGAWSQVLASIERMTPPARAEAAWTYWRARALVALGKPEEARPVFARIAGEHHYYGRLAGDELGQPMLLPAATRPTPKELEQAAGVPGLQRALALFALGMRIEGIREWNWALRGMDDRQLLAAAELARTNEIWDRAIATADRTIALHDFSLRYPAPHRAIFSEQAKARELEEPLVFGLVRQESRFIANARSSAGASGLMQLMPATARWVASKLGLKNFSPAHVTSIDMNAMLGTYYLRRVLDDMYGQAVVATAAYNAGPGRARNWLDASPMEGAVYIESIPFGETRDYVKKVMTNAFYYAAVLGGKSMSLKERLGRVAPRATLAATETP